jgi:anti-sigma B factor antagonist
MAGLDEATRSTESGREEHFALSLSFDEAVFCIELFGELDLASAPQVEHALARAEETSAETIVLDLSALHFIDSSGIRVLLAASERSRRDSNRLRFLRGTAQVEKTLALCGLDDRLPFLD